ncbi:hypothetical protein [Nitrosomonas sp. Nm33]|uniref:hypothetical protein n=1 Tax=Nitrosomonas sp. Nm33 TaxID=133724 RepID=UPI00115F8AD3|nr:hypothetical protein [Nitrosomonas sp. Nm33]
MARRSDKVRFDLEMELHLPYTVDLSQYNQLTNADLAAHIDRMSVAIYDKNVQTDETKAENLAKV